MAANPMAEGPTARAGGTAAEGGVLDVGVPLITVGSIAANQLLVGAIFLQVLQAMSCRSSGHHHDGTWRRPEVGEGRRSLLATTGILIAISQTMDAFGAALPQANPPSPIAPTTISHFVAQYLQMGAVMLTIRLSHFRAASLLAHRPKLRAVAVIVSGLFAATTIAVAAGQAAALGVDGSNLNAATAAVVRARLVLGTLPPVILALRGLYTAQALVAAVYFLFTEVFLTRVANREGQEHCHDFDKRRRLTPPELPALPGSGGGSLRKRPILEPLVVHRQSFSGVPSSFRSTYAALIAAVFLGHAILRTLIIFGLVEVAPLFGMGIALVVLRMFQCPDHGSHDYYGGSSLAPSDSISRYTDTGNGLVAHQELEGLFMSLPRAHDPQLAATAVVPPAAYRDGQRPWDHPVTPASATWPPLGSMYAPSVYAATTVSYQALPSQAQYVSNAMPTSVGPDSALLELPRASMAIVPDEYAQVFAMTNNAEQQHQVDHQMPQQDAQSLSEMAQAELTRQRSMVAVAEAATTLPPVLPLSRQTTIPRGNPPVTTPVTTHGTGGSTVSRSLSIAKSAHLRESPHGSP